MAENLKDFPFGFLNIYKPKGMTSHDVISRLRRVTKIKQIGHSGTLDPFAVGVLPVAIGKATKLIEYLNDDKQYLATVQFGKNTDTYDVDGEVVESFDKKISKEEICTALKNFEGEISQIPPIYSAIKVNGKKLYEYARKGEEIEIKPRVVTIYQIQLKHFDYDAQVAKILVSCSKGTYIRSIAYDLGKTLGCGAYLSALERTKAGLFATETSVQLDLLTDISEVGKNIISPLEVIKIPVVDLNEKNKERISHGMSIKKEGLEDGDIVFLVYSGKIHAVGKVDGNKILAKKVFEVI